MNFEVMGSTTGGVSGSKQGTLKTIQWVLGYAVVSRHDTRVIPTKIVVSKTPIKSFSFPM